MHPGGGVKAMGGADSGGRREGERMSNLAVSLSTSHTSQLKASSDLLIICMYMELCQRDVQNDWQTYVTFKVKGL